MGEAKNSFICLIKYILTKIEIMEKLTDVELSSVVLEETKTRTWENCHPNSVIVQEDTVLTPHGNVHVAVQGAVGKPAIVTYHDIGLNHTTQFQGFFNYPDMQTLLKHFCVYHINGVGQEDGAAPLPQIDTASPADGKLTDAYKFPTMDELAETIGHVLDFYSLKSVMGLGVGMGSNVLCRFAMANPKRVSALIIVNTCGTQSGWVEWGYQKLSNRYLQKYGMNSFTQDYLVWHHFGYKTMEENLDLVNFYRDTLMKSVQPYNLALLVESYVWRTDLGLDRDGAGNDGKKIECPVMNVVGDNSPHIDDSMWFNGRLNPAKSNFVKFSDCGGMVLEEVPQKMAESLLLFLQGLGYVPHLRIGREHGRITSPATSPVSPTSLAPAIC